MNIMFISPGLYPCITGGVEIHNYHLIKGLAKKGNKIWVVTSCEHDWNDKHIIPLIINKNLLLIPTLSILFYTFFKITKLKKQIDVIQVPYTSNSILIYPILLAKKLFNVNYVVTIHGGGMHPWKPKIFHKMFFKDANTIVAVSEVIRREYEKRTSRTILIRGGRASPFIESKSSKDELKKRYGYKNKDLIILSVGSIKKIKGSDTLLYAIMDLGKKYIKKNNIKLIYVGDGPMKTMLKEKVEERNFIRYINFLGTIPHEEIPHIYKLADIYVIASMFEGKPQSLLDAMFNGLPIIGSDVNGINNVIINGVNGLLFENGNIKGLKDKLINMVENKELRKKLSNAVVNIRDSKRDKFEYVISQYNKLYEGCVRH